MPHVITRHQASAGTPVFFVNYDGSYILKIISTDAGGGTLQSLLTFFPDSNGIYAVSASKVGMDETTGFNHPSYMNISTDSGNTWTRTYTIGNYHLVFISFAQHFFKDLSNDQIIWHGTADHATASVPDNSVAYYTKDGGSNWNRVQVDSYTGWRVDKIFAVPTHDGRYGYIVTTLRQEPFSPPGTYRVLIYKVDSTDGSFTSIELASDTWGTADSGFFRGTVKLGATDKLYLLTYGYGSLWTVIYSTNTETLVHDGNGASQIEANQNLHKQITCSPNGTLLWVLSDWFSTATPFLHIWRSTDGTNWTLKNCTSLPPSGSRGGQWDYVEFSSDTLFMAFENDGSNNTIYGMYSVDDGVTWQRTGVLYNNPSLTISNPFDHSGVISP